jgi:hypothetical protein
MILEGRASEVQGDLLEVMGELGFPTAPGSGMPSQALAELRSEER